MVPEAPVIVELKIVLLLEVNVTGDALEILLNVPEASVKFETVLELITDVTGEFIEMIPLRAEPALFA